MTRIVKFRLVSEMTYYVLTRHQTLSSTLQKRPWYIELCRESFCWISLTAVVLINCVYSTLFYCIDCVLTVCDQFYRSWTMNLCVRFLTPHQICFRRHYLPVDGGVVCLLSYRIFTFCVLYCSCCCCRWYILVLCKFVKKILNTDWE